MYPMIQLALGSALKLYIPWGLLALLLAILRGLSWEAELY